MTREEVEELIRWFPKWPRYDAPEGVYQDSLVCGYCYWVDLNNGNWRWRQCIKCLWEQVLQRTRLSGYPGDGCSSPGLAYLRHYGYTPQRLLAKFLIENNLARPSKVPGKWEVW